jgi:hypothetical protein
VTTAFVTAGAGFLLAVLWFDLMFDVQVRRRRDAVAAVDSIATYYKRVTTDARPMNRLVAIAMVATIAAIVGQLVAGDVPAWASWVSLALVVAAVGLAGAHTVPAAVRLGAGAGTSDERVRAAGAILRDHVVCFALIATTLVVQLGFAH